MPINGQMNSTVVAHLFCTLPFFALLHELTKIIKYEIKKRLNENEYFLDLGYYFIYLGNLKKFDNFHLNN